MPHKDREPSKPLSDTPIVQQIDILLSNGGDVSQTTKDKLMFSAIRSMMMTQCEIQNSLNNAITATENLEERVMTLEKRNIVTWCIRHPGPTATIGTLFFLLLISHYGVGVLKLIGISLPIF